MRIHTPTTRTAAVAVAAGLLLTGCTSGTTATPAPAAPVPAGFGHVHAIVDAGDGSVLLGTHTGIYTLDDAGDLSGPVGGTDFDAMGLAAAGDILYASGHPGPDTPAELGAPHLGVIRSTDAGATWEPVAFTGQEDFHVLTATGTGAIYGIGSSSITVRTSIDGGATWVDGADLTAADLTATSDGTLYAATAEGVLESRDAGVGFVPVPDAPLLYQLEADPTGGLVGVDTDGILWRLTGTGSWEEAGTVTGTVQALGTAMDGSVVLVDDRGIVWIRDTDVTIVLPMEAMS